MRYTVVIPSNSKRNLQACLDAVMLHEDAPKIIVVDDGLGFFDYQTHNVMIAQGEKPFVFARNVNIGIRVALSAGPSNIILLNDDALLETQLGFTYLNEMLDHRPEYGIIAAVTNSVGNPEQLRRPEWAHSLRLERRMVCFVCVAISHATITSVGMLDERYIGYGLDDDDYCRRVMLAGLKIGIYDGCFVEHTKLHSSFRTSGQSDFLPNMKLFIQKWGVDNWGRAKSSSQFKALFP